MLPIEIILLFYPKSTLAHNKGDKSDLTLLAPNEGAKNHLEENVKISKDAINSAITLIFPRVNSIQLRKITIAMQGILRSLENLRSLISQVKIEIGAIHLHDSGAIVHNLRKVLLSYIPRDKFELRDTIRILTLSRETSYRLTKQVNIRHSDIYFNFDKLELINKLAAWKPGKIQNLY